MISFEVYRSCPFLPRGRQKLARLDIHRGSQVWMDSMKYPLDKAANILFNMTGQSCDYTVIRESRMPKSTFFNLSEDKRKAILELSIEEFARNDYRNASISNIVARAGIAKGSLYQYFDDKRDLYLYLIQLAWEEKKRFLAQSQPPDPGMNLFDFLRWMVLEGTRFELSSPLLAQVVYRAMFSDRPLGDEPFDRMRKAALDYYKGLVEMGIGQGVIDPQLDRGLAVFLFSTIFNHFGQYLLEREQVDLQDLANGNINYQQLPVEGLTNQVICILQRGLAPIAD